MSKMKLVFIEGTDKTGKDTICQQLDAEFDNILWMNAPLQCTNAHDEFESLIKTSDIYKANMLEYWSWLPIAASGKLNDKILLVNRSILSSFIYSVHESRKDVVLSHMNAAFTYLTELFDVSMHILCHSNDSLLSTADDEHSRSWGSTVNCAAKRKRINTLYKNTDMIPGYAAPESTYVHTVLPCYASNDDIYKSIVSQIFT